MTLKPARERTPHYIINSTLVAVLVASWFAHKLPSFSTAITAAAGIMTVLGIWLALESKKSLLPIDSENSTSSDGGTSGTRQSPEDVANFHNFEFEAKPQESKTVSTIYNHPGISIPHDIRTLDSKDRYWTNIVRMNERISKDPGHGGGDSFVNVLNVVHHIVYHEERPPVSMETEKIVVEILDDDDLLRS